MEIIHLPKGAGKTDALIKLAAINSYHMIVKDHESIRRIVDRAKELKLDFSFPLTYREFALREYHGLTIAGFVVDDADEFIQYCSPSVKVMGLSINSKSDWVKIESIEDLPDEIMFMELIGKNKDISVKNNHFLHHYRPSDKNYISERAIYWKQIPFTSPV